LIAAALGARKEFAAVQNLKSIDVVAVRLYLDRRIKARYRYTCVKRGNDTCAIDPVPKQRMLRV
jgi:hypothetical protein